MSGYDKNRQICQMLTSPLKESCIYIQILITTTVKSHLLWTVTNICDLKYDQNPPIIFFIILLTICQGNVLINKPWQKNNFLGRGDQQAAARYSYSQHLSFIRPSVCFTCLCHLMEYFFAQDKSQQHLDFSLYAFSVRKTMKLYAFPAPSNYLNVLF